jgi:hypothetical protein
MPNSIIHRDAFDFATSIADDPTHRLLRIIELLDQARSGDDAPWALSMAMASIERNAFADETPAIGAEQKVQLMEAVKAALVAAARWLPSAVSDELLAAGARGVLHQIAYWYLGRAKASDFPQDLLSASSAYARILRNHLHNLSLASEIDARSQRYGTAIEALAAFRSRSPLRAQASVSAKLN